MQSSWRFFHHKTLFKWIHSLSRTKSPSNSRWSSPEDDTMQRRAVKRRRYRQLTKFSFASLLFESDALSPKPQMKLFLVFLHISQKSPIIPCWSSTEHDTMRRRDVTATMPTADIPLNFRLLRCLWKWRACADSLLNFLFALLFIRSDALSPLFWIKAFLFFAD